MGKELGDWTFHMIIQVSIRSQEGKRDNFIRHVVCHGVSTATNSPSRCYYCFTLDSKLWSMSSRVIPSLPSSFLPSLPATVKHKPHEAFSWKRLGHEPRPKIQDPMKRHVKNVSATFLQLKITLIVIPLYRKKKKSPPKKNAPHAPSRSHHMERPSYTVAPLCAIPTILTQSSPSP